MLLTTRPAHRHPAPHTRIAHQAARSLLLCALLSVSTASHAELPAASNSPVPTPFSSLPAGPALPAGWLHQTLPGVENPNHFEIASDNGQSVLRIVSQRSASTLTFPVPIDVADAPRLSWRWKVSRAIDGSDFSQKSGDDYAARVYVLFDLPSDRLSLGDRLKISTAKLLHGADIPAAALCYVWGNKQTAGETGWNPYTDRLRMIVVESGNQHAGAWQNVSRDVAADFVAAFGGPVPPIAGVAVSADTDNTGESVETLIGDIRLEAAR